MRVNILLYVFLPLVLVLSCKPRVPGKYIQPGKFEDILYDCHLADAMAENDGDGGVNQYEMALYRQAVLKKHGISQAEFDTSLVYYTRHADRLHKIYENLSKRLGDEALALGASANDIIRYGDLKSSRDTSNLWIGVSSCVLVPDAPYNVMSFEITADSSYHKGDRIIFSFNSDFIYKDGIKDGVALLAVQFTNDSVASNTVRVLSNSNYSVTVSDKDNLGIKSIRGFVCLGKNNSDKNANSLRIMSVYNIRLVRMRGMGNVVDKPVEADGLNNDDTVLRRKSSVPDMSEDTLKEPGVRLECEPLERRVEPDVPLNMRQVNHQIKPIQ